MGPQSLLCTQIRRFGQATNFLVELICTVNSFSGRLVVQLNIQSYVVVMDSLSTIVQSCHILHLSPCS